MVRVRFAPSPTGYIHIGNLRTALLNWLFAKQNNGTFLLRFDDTDAERSKAEFVEAIKDDLAWLGLTYDEMAFQSHRLNRYDEVRDQLITQGLLYPCYETSDELEKKRKVQRAQGKPPVYDRSALALSQEQRDMYEREGRKPHWRFLLSNEAIHFHDLIRGDVTLDSGSLSDPVLIRADGSYLYTLSSVVDDVDFGITHIIRGDDHVSNSAVQIEIFRALQAEAPSFAHHSMLVDEQGGPLSKRLGGLSIQNLRADGYEPGALLTYLAQLGHGEPVEISQDPIGLTEGFSLSRLSKAPARLFVSELDAINGKILSTTPFDSVAERLPNDPKMQEIWPIIRDNVTFLKDVEAWLSYFYGERDTVILDENLRQAAIDLLPEGPFDEQTWATWTGLIKSKTGLSGKSLFMPLRQALTGQSRGPEMAMLLPLLDRDLVLKRFEKA